MLMRTLGRSRDRSEGVKRLKKAGVVKSNNNNNRKKNRWGETTQPDFFDVYN